MSSTSTTYVAVVDDDQSVCRSFARLLRSAGIQPITYASAEAFLADSKRPQFDCMVFDVQLGGMSGIELAQVLAATEVGRAPVIYITAHDDPGNPGQRRGRRLRRLLPQERLRRRRARRDSPADRLTRGEPSMTLRRQRIRLCLLGALGRGRAGAGRGRPPLGLRGPRRPRGLGLPQPRVRHLQARPPAVTDRHPRRQGGRPAGDPFRIPAVAAEDRRQRPHHPGELRARQRHRGRRRPATSWSSSTSTGRARKRSTARRTPWWRTWCTATPRASSPWWRCCSTRAAPAR